jgi:hypothetical protein
VRAKTFWLPGVAEMALFRELFAAAGCSQAADTGGTGAAAVAGVCVSGNQNAPSAQREWKRAALACPTFRPVE